MNQKLIIRKQLQDLLLQFHPDEIDMMKRPVCKNSQAEGDIKRVKKSTTSDSCLTSAASSEAPQTEGTKATHSPQLDTHQLPSPPLQTPTYNEAKPGTSQKSNKAGEGHQAHTKKISMWSEGCFEVLTLEGHNDIVLAVDCLDTYILSASRDTTVRVWRVGSTKEERSLRGHTASVTAVSFLPESLTASVITKLENDLGMVSSHQKRTSGECRKLAVSGGLDCTLKVWDILSGETLGSIYTYNGITCLGCGSWGVVTGTEGGRLEFWCLASNQRITYVDAFESQVTTFQVCKNDVYAGSQDGEFGVWQLDSNKNTLGTKYILETESLPQLSLRQLSAVVEHKGKCYFGDGGPNIKVLEWKKNKVSRLKNHRGDIGMTDSLAVTPDGYLMAASFLVDSGCPSINVRELQSGKYFASLIDEDEGRYLTLSVTSNVIVAGGHLLKVWIHEESSLSHSRSKMAQYTSERVRPVFLHKLATPPVDSGSEEDTDWASSTEEEDDSQLLQFNKERNQVEGSSWWCSVL